MHTQKLGANVTRPVGQCDYETIVGANLNASQILCVTKASWGSIASDGRIKVGSEGLFHEVSLPTGQSVLAGVGYTDRLYVAVPATGGYMIGYYDNAKSALHYQLGPNAYIVVGTLHMLAVPEINDAFVFSSHGFSSNGQWLIGTHDGSMIRINLTNGNALRFATSSLDDSDAIFTPAVSNNGAYIALAGANFWRLELYDMIYCSYGHDSDAWYDTPSCETKRTFSDEELGGQYPSNPEFKDDGLSLRYNAVASGVVNEMLLWAGSPVSMVAGGMGVDYVALGDSYSSGEGDAGNYLSGTDGTSEYPGEKCHVSTTSYSARLSSQFSGDYFSVACSGAVTADVVSAEGYRGQFSQLATSSSNEYRQSWHDNALVDRTPGRIAQADFVGQYHPKVVTMTIGGNDVKFKDTLQACIAGFSTCDQVAKNRGEMGKKIAGVYDQLVSTYRDIVQRSPGTKVYIVGYPQFIEEGASQCGFNVGFDGTERRFIAEGTKYLNQVVQAAAYEVGAYYVDVENAFGNEALCGSNPNAMNGITLGDDIAPLLGFKFIGQESFHPTARGHELIAQAITRQIGSLEDYHDPLCSDQTSTYSCRSSEGKNPAMPAYFASALSPSDTDYVASTQITNESTQSASGTHSFSLLDVLLQSLSTFALSIRSELQQLGTYTVGTDGLASGTYTLPDNLPSGYHTLVIDGLTPDGQTVRYEQVIYVYNPQLAPENDACGGLVPASGLDQDSDGIDDACDGQITAASQQTVYSPYDMTDYGTTTAATNVPGALTETPVAQQAVGSRYVTIADMLVAASERSTQPSGVVVPSTIKTRSDETPAANRQNPQQAKDSSLVSILVQATGGIALMAITLWLLLKLRKKL